MGGLFWPGGGLGRDGCDTPSTPALPAQLEVELPDRAGRDRVQKKECRTREQGTLSNFDDDDGYHQHINITIPDRSGLP